jgi:RNase H-fold protein (predicted Holliday junction resolvase)
MGNQTTSKQWQKKLTENISLKVTLVNEKNSTLEARDKYWQMYPPQGLKKLIPKGLRVPPCPIDDIVAIILIERYLQQHSNR